MTPNQKPSPGKFLKSIQGKLILLLITLVIPNVSLQAYFHYDRFQTRRAEELQANLELARAVSKNFETFLHDILVDELLIGTALTSSQPPSDLDQDRILAKARTARSTIGHLFWVNPAGRILAGTESGSIGVDLTDRPYFREILAGRETVVSDLMLSKKTRRLVFTISRGIRNGEGDLIGIVVAGITPDELKGVLGIERSPGADVSIIDSKGMLVYRYPVTDYTWEQRNWLTRVPMLEDALEARETVTRITSASTGKSRLAAFAPMPSIGWVAAASRSEDVVLDALKSQVFPQAGLRLFVAFVTFGIALFFSRKISLSIGNLRDHALALGRGERQVPLAKSGTSELDDLADAFNKMSEDVVRLRQVERIEATEALRESENKFREQAIRLQAVLDAAPAMIWTTHDRDGRTISGNRAASELLRLPESVNMSKSGPEPELLAHYRLFHDGKELAPPEMPIHRVAATGEPLLDYPLEFVFDNAKHFLLGNVVPILDAEGGPAGAVAAFLDVTRHNQMDEELRKSRDELEIRVQERTVALETLNEELRQVPSKLIAVQEEERRRLASELHDSIGQTLAAVKFWVEIALKFREEGSDADALYHLERFVPILQRSIEETRNIYMGLRPPMLEDMGLLPALEWLRRECMRLYPARHIELETGIKEEEIPESLKVNIFRIVQEALNNIAKHSKAEWVDISIIKDGSAIELAVSDDGVGMDLDQILRTSTARSLGLTSMRERAEIFGGSFSIESTPSEGTTIRALWSIEVDGQLQ